MLVKWKNTLLPAISLLLCLFISSCDLTGLLNEKGSPSKKVAAPVISGSTPTNNPRPTWTWTVDPEAKAISYKLDSTAWLTAEPGMTSFTPQNDLTDGSHVFSARAQDAAGKWSSTSEYAIVVDTAPPSPPAVSAAVVDTQARPHWSWTASGDSTGFRYQLDAELAEGWSIAGAGALTFTPDADLSMAEHTLFVQAVDLAGNWSASGSATIDLLPDTPEVSGTTPTRNTTPTWTWTIGAVISAFSFRLDGGAWTEVGAEVRSFTPPAPLSEGTHTLGVRAKMTSGAWSQEASFGIVIDLTPPGPPLVQGTTPTGERYPLWQWTVTDAGDIAAFRYQLDGEAGSWTEASAGTTSYRLSFPLVEPHTLYVQASDQVGNWSASGSLRLEPAWSTQIIDSNVTTTQGQQISIVINQAGNPAASYADSASHDLLLMQWNGTAWQREVLDGGGAGLRIISRMDYQGHRYFAYTNPTERALTVIYWSIDEGYVEKKATVDNNGSAPITMLRMDVDQNPRPRILVAHEGLNARWFYIMRTLQEYDPPAGVVSEFDPAITTGPEGFEILLSLTASELRMRVWDGLWGAPTPIFQTAADAASKISVTTDRPIRLGDACIQRVAFSNASHEIRYVYGTRNGFSSTTLIHPASSSEIGALQIAFDYLNAKPVIAYIIGSDLYCYVNGSEELVDSGVGTAVSVTVDTGGRIHLVYYDAATGHVKYAARR